MSWLPLALGLLGPGAPAVATPPAPTPFVVHENDPKAQGRLPAYRGRGFRAAQSRRPQPTIAAALTPTSFPADGVALAAWLPLDELDGAGSGRWSSRSARRATRRSSPTSTGRTASGAT
jgi:hypothetical protein